MNQIQAQYTRNQTSSKENDESNIHAEEDEPLVVKEITKVNYIAGRLQFFVQAWKEITSNNRILNWIKGYSIRFKNKPVQFRIVDTSSQLTHQSTELRGAIAQLIAKNAIEECIEIHDQFISPYFLVPKPDGSNRFIINLKELNKFIDPPHFKMEDISSVKNLINIIWSR